MGDLPQIWQYPGVQELIPSRAGIYEGTPVRKNLHKSSMLGSIRLFQVVNDVFLEHIKKRRCAYVRGQPVRLTKKGVLIEARKGKNNSKKAGKKKHGRQGPLIEDVAPGEERVLEADVIIFATGYKKPTLDFLPKELFPEGYEVREPRRPRNTH